MSEGRLSRPLREPQPIDRLREARTLLEPARLFVKSPSLLTAPRGDSRRLVTFPGFGMTDATLAPLRGFLAGRGHRPHGWGLGVNRGDVAEVLPKCFELVRELAAQDGRPVNVLGWSLGGVIAREIAREAPELIERVATMGTPLFGPRHTLTRSRFTDAELDRIERQIAVRSERPITRPVLSIYGRNDGVVDWRACVDERTPEVSNVEVASSHAGMGIDPDVWVALARWFAASPGA